MSGVDYCICIEELARVCPAVALSVAAHNGLCTSHIAHVRQLPRRSSNSCRGWSRGEVLGAWGLTEPAPAAMPPACAPRPSATETGWVINGAKTFITHGRIGGVMVVMAVTDRAKGNRGISAFVVERGTPGHDARQEGRTSSGCARATRAR